MTKFTFYDTEAAWDETLHEAYQSIDPRQRSHRIGSKRIIAAAAFDVEVSAEGHIACEAIKSWTEYDVGDERAIVAGLFDHLRARPDRMAVGFGSVADDLPILTLAAMEAGLMLPSQFLPPQPGAFRSGRRMHLDLGLALKGSGKTWHHLSEVCLRIGIPVDLLKGKITGSAPVTAEGWRNLRAHVELDTALLAIATLAWQRTQGQACLDPTIAALAVLDWLRRNGHLTETKLAMVADTCRAFELDILHTDKLAA